MPQIRKDTTILEQYRERYEAGEVTLIGISKDTNISDTIITKYIAINFWNKKLAKKNRLLKEKEPLIAKMQTYREAFENGLITRQEIRKILKCDILFIARYIKESKWDCTKNILLRNQKSQANLFKNFIPMTPENQKKGVLAAQKTYRRRKKLKEEFQNMEIGEIFYTTNGLPLLFQGIKSGKLKAKHALYSKYTYTDEEIKKYETQKT